MLEEVLSQQNYSYFCQSKAVSSSNETEQSIWNFLKVGGCVGGCGGGGAL